MVLCCPFYMFLNIKVITILEITNQLLQLVESDKSTASFESIRSTLVRKSTNIDSTKCDNKNVYICTHCQLSAFQRLFMVGKRRRWEPIILMSEHGQLSRVDQIYICVLMYQSGIDYIISIEKCSW